MKLSHTRYFYWHLPLYLSDEKSLTLRANLTRENLVIGLHLDINMEPSKKIKNKILKSTHITFLFLLSFLSSRGQAEINMIEGSFRFEQKFRIDILKLQLAYSSRSNQRGLFGFGWCSNLENKIVKSSDILLLYQCPYRTPLRFKSQPDPSPVSRILSMIDTDSSKPSSSRIFYSEASENGYITEDLNSWTWHRPDGSFTQFDDSGRLIKDSHSDGSLFEYHYSAENLLSFIRVNKIQTLFLSYSKDGQVISLEAPLSEDNLKFSFENHQLTAVSSFKGSLFQFTYDSLDNLTRIQGNSPPNLQTIQYDDDDRAIQYIAGNCATRFSYLDQTSTRLKIKRSRLCANRPATKSVFLFSFSTRDDLQKYLEKVSIFDEDGVRHIHFDPQTGTPLKNRSRFIFDEKQRLAEFSSSKNTVFRLIYNKNEETPSFIHIVDEGYIKLAWADSSPQIVDIQPQGHSERLRQRLVEALETIAKIRKEKSE